MPTESKGESLEAISSTALPERKRQRRKVTLSRLSLHARVAQRLREMIVTGELKEGEKVPVNALAAELDVSPTPLREALKVLAEEQLLELIPNRGARVVPVTIQETRALFEVMAGLEGTAAKLAAERITPEQFQTLEDLHAKMCKHYEAEEKEPYFRLNRVIHDTIVKYANNAILSHLRSRLAVRAERLRFISVMDGALRAQAVRAHADLIEALRDRDGQRAMQIWSDHLAAASVECCAVLAERNVA